MTFKIPYSVAKKFPYSYYIAPQLSMNTTTTITTTTTTITTTTTTATTTTS